MMHGSALYEFAKILGHSNIKMTELYAKLARQHRGGNLEAAGAREMRQGERRVTDVRVLFARLKPAVLRRR